MKRGRTKSEVIRDAIGLLAKSVEAQEEAEHPYDKIRDLIGSAHGGPPDLPCGREAKLNRFIILPA